MYLHVYNCVSAAVVVVVIFTCFVYKFAYAFFYFLLLFLEFGLVFFFGDKNALLVFMQRRNEKLKKMKKMQTKPFLSISLCPGNMLLLLLLFYLLSLLLLFLHLLPSNGKNV